MYNMQCVCVCVCGARAHIGLSTEYMSLHPVYICLAVSSKLTAIAYVFALCVHICIAHADKTERNAEGTTATAPTMKAKRKNG